MREARMTTEKVNLAEDYKPTRIATEQQAGFDRALHLMHDLATVHGGTSWTSKWDGAAWVVVENDSGKEFRVEDKPKRKLPAVPNAMHNEHLTVLNNHTISAAKAAFHNAQSRQDEDWHKGERIPAFMYQKGNGTVLIELRPPGKGPDDDRRLSDEELLSVWTQLTGKWNGEKVPRITSLAGDVLETLLGQAEKSAPDKTGLRWITAEQILDYRGLEKITKATEGGDRRTAGHRTERIEEVAEAMRQLNNTWVLLNVVIVDDEDTRGRKRTKQYKWHSRLIAIADTITQEEVTPESTSKVAVAWSFALGSWATPFLEGPNHFTAELSQQCLKYDQYHELWEKRLADYFTRALRTNAKNGSTLPRQIGPVIEELSLPVDEVRPLETRKSFEKAMDRIRDDGVIASWRYRDGAPKLKRYGWLTDWLGLFIEVTASDGTKQRYRKIAEKSETRRQRAEALETAKQVKRKAKKDE